MWWLIPVTLNHPDRDVSLELRQHGDTNALVCCLVKVCLFWPRYTYLALAYVILINRSECTSLTIPHTAWVGETRLWLSCATVAWRPSIRDWDYLCVALQRPLSGFQETLSICQWLTQARDRVKQPLLGCGPGLS